MVACASPYAECVSLGVLFLLECCAKSGPGIHLSTLVSDLCHTSKRMFESENTQVIPPEYAVFASLRKW